MVNVDANVEQVVIPVGLVIAAPLAFLLQFGDVVIDLGAVFTVLRGVAIDFGFLGLQP